MNNLNLGRAVLVIQSFAIFVALSTLLGRIYFISYYHTLGIPTSEVRLSVTDYSIISPDTTILGIGLAFASTVFVWLIKPDYHTQFRPRRVVIGLLIVFLATGTGMVDSIAFFPQGLRLLGPGLFGAWKLILVVLIMTGGVVTASGFPYPTIDSTTQSELRQRLAQMRLLFPTMLILGVVGMLIVSTMYATLIGRLEARNTLENNPPARITFTSSDSLAAVNNDGQICPKDSLVCELRVILIGETFVYLSPLEVDLLEYRRLYAFPATDIVGISYMLDD